LSVVYAKSALLPNGWAHDVRIGIRDGAIESVEAGVPAVTGDERHAIAVPALVNLHSHAFQRAMAGLAERRGPGADTFWTWRETMYRFALTMSPEDIEAVAAQLYVEMLEAGFGAVAEFHYLHHAPDGRPYANLAEMAARIVTASRETGIGLTLLPVFYAHATFGGMAPWPQQQRFLCDLDLFARLFEESGRLLDQARREGIGVAPHSLRAATPDELAMVVKLAPGGPIHIHAAEQVKEVEDCVAALRARPVRWLLDNAGVDARWVLIHATHMDEGETRDLARAQAVAGLCPITEANLGDGVFPAHAFVGAGGRFGVGSDSNVLIGVAAELRQLEYAQRLALRMRNVLALAGGSTGRRLYDGALAGGARALARDCGRLAPGAVADIVTLKADHPTLIGKTGDAILDAWIFSAGNAAVDCVWSAGRQLVSEGRHAAREGIAARYRATLTKLSAG
jgi:formimidoylglutamate deiminase